LLRDSTTPLSIPIPAGLSEGFTLRLQGQGDQAHPREKGVENGDLLVTVVTRPNRFERRGQHLHLKHEITLRQALLGFRIDIELLDGSTVAIERLDTTTQPGTILTLEGKGLPPFDPRMAQPSGTADRGMLSLFRTNLVQPLERLVDSALGVKDGVIPRGDLVVEFQVQYPKGHIFTTAEKEELKKLLLN
jgi:DnaJ-class molecular chaperone